MHAESFYTTKCIPYIIMMYGIPSGLYIIIGTILGFIIALNIFFVTVPLLGYFKKGQKIALIFAEYYAGYLITFILLELGFLDFMTVGIKTPFYYLMMLVGMRIGTVISAVFFYMFYAELAEIGKKGRFISIGIAVFIIFLLIVTNEVMNYSNEGFRPKYIAWTLQAFYVAIIYLMCARLLLNIARRSVELKTHFYLLAIGNIMYPVFISLMFLRMPFGSEPWIDYIQIIDWFIIAVGLTLQFIGFIGLAELGRRDPPKDSVSD